MGCGKIRCVEEANGGEGERVAAAMTLVSVVGEGALLREGDGMRELGRLPGRSAGEEMLGDGAGLAAGLMRTAAGTGVARELGDGAGLE